jgi:hypothetical protein
VAATWLETAARLADHVIPPVPVRQWVISVPKRLRGFLADRPRAVAVLTKIFLTEIERLLLAAASATPDADIPSAACPRLGGISFLHRFGSALNHHVHLHACVTVSSCRLPPKQRVTPRRRSCPRAASRLSRSWPAHQLGRARADP